MYKSILKTKHPKPIHPISSYFSVGSILEGLGKVFHLLYGITIEPSSVQSGEVWDEEVRKINIKDEGGKLLGVIYCDLFRRPGKFDYPAHFTVQCSRRVDDDQRAFSCIDIPCTNLTEWFDGKLYQLPISALVCCFDPPTKEKPSLLNIESYRTLFHEMGHAIHSILGRTDFHHISGTRCQVDFVETPSILMEMVADSPQVVSLCARHFKTNEALPYACYSSFLELLEMDKILDLQDNLFLSLLDQQFHQPLEPSFSSTECYALVRNSFGSTPFVPNTQPQCSFKHIYNYAAAHYSYFYAQSFAYQLWTKLFQKSISRDAGDIFRHTILSKGTSKE